MYQLDPSRLDLAREFHQFPFGPHSAELRMLLNRMRKGPVKGRHILVQTTDDRYALATLSGVRGVPPTLVEGKVYDDPAAAEWEVFKIRWLELSGQTLAIGDPEAEATLEGQAELTFKTVVGYVDRISACPGETVAFKISSLQARPYEAQLVRLVCGDDGPGGAGFAEVEIDADCNGEHAGRVQPLCPGSYAVTAAADSFGALGDIAFGATVWPTLLNGREQAILGTWSESDERGFCLLLDADGCLAIRLGDGQGHVETHTTGVALRLRTWTRVAAMIDTDGVATLLQHEVDRHGLEERREDVLRSSATWLAATKLGARPLYIGAWHRTDTGIVTTAGHFNGKIEAPRLLAAPDDDAALLETVRAPATELAPTAVIAAWDFGLEIDSERIVDVGPNGHHGTTVQLPNRGMTGSNWDGSEMSWRHAPQHYGAIHFHEDDLYDAGWETDFEWRVADDLPSGVYAMRLRDGGAEEHVPVFVRPPRGTKTSKLAFLASTATYMAYANGRLHYEAPGVEIMRGRMAVLSPSMWFILEHDAVGPSLYDHHTDGSGVSISSRLRPVLDLKPRNRIWSFTGDTHVTAFLEHEGIDYDVITDEDLHREGAELLQGYQAVVTGAHPEYVSSAILDALENFVDGGGRLAYLGGNGFYWNTVFHPTLPGVIEVRRTEDGTRAWKADPGEYYHQFTGEYGGPVAAQGSPPQPPGRRRFCGPGFRRLHLLPPPRRQPRSPRRLHLRRRRR